MNFQSITSPASLFQFEPFTHRGLQVFYSLKYFNHFDNIFPCGSQPTRIYGTPKTHKLESATDALTCRPIDSTIGR